MKLKVKRLTETAILPEKNNLTDAGFDIFADEDINLESFEDTKPVSTGIAIEIPDGYYGRLKSRSGNTVKTKLRVHEGTIDSGYRGEVKVMCYGNHEIKKGDKFAQLIIQPLPFFVVEEVNKLEESDRGEKGFGSSGTKRYPDDKK